MKYRLLLVGLFVVLLVAPDSRAGEIFLNGVRITGVTDRTFTDVKSVRIDEKGNIHLDAAQYEVKRAAESAVSATGTDVTPKLRNQYYLTTAGNGKHAQFDIIVTVNGIEKARFRSTDHPVIREITDWLQPGQNQILITARKRGQEERLSNSAEDRITLLIGRGRSENRMVKMERVLLRFQCDAAMTTDQTKTFRIAAE